jgi:hypothetical protein
MTEREARRKYWEAYNNWENFHSYSNATQVLHYASALANISDDYDHYYDEACDIISDFGELR